MGADETTPRSVSGGCLILSVHDRDTVEFAVDYVPVKVIGFRPFPRRCVCVSV